MNCSYYKLKHQVIYHQHIAETVFSLHVRKPDPDLKDGLRGLLFLLIEFLVFLGLAVVREYWTEPDRKRSGKRLPFLLH